MPRAPWPARSALLMATAAALLSVARAPHALEQLNPWLSACDLVHNASEDLQGACTANFHAPLPKHPITIITSTSTTSTMSTSTWSCPAACDAAAATRTSSPTTTNTTNQCLLYLEEAHKVAVCDGRFSAEQRLRALDALRLRHCCEHAVASTLRPHHRRQLLAGGAPCRRHLDALLAIDALAARISCEFTEVLTRYDCAQPYSIVYHCDDCKEAYRRWVCSSLVPHLTGSGGRVRPCRSVCQAVEQRCPYLLPGDRAPAYPTQYAGEPTFLCLDPNIPETGTQRERSLHGVDECCYTYCGGPGRPPCLQCPSGASNTTWSQPACAAPGARTIPPCKTIAGISAAPTSPAHPVLVLALLLLLLLLTDTDSYSPSPPSLCSLLTSCVVCARTTPHAHTHTTSTWTS